MILLRNLGLSPVLTFASERDPRARAFLSANHMPSILRSDASIPEKLPDDVDIYVAGPPCVCFSPAGREEGWEGEHGGHMWTCVERITESQPRAFVLENVPELEYRDAGVGLAEVINTLTAEGYNVQHFVTCASQHGLPVRRRRLHVPGTRPQSRRRGGSRRAWGDASRVAALRVPGT